MILEIISVRFVQMYAVLYSPEQVRSLKMLPVYICEDIIEQLEGIKSIIRTLIDTYNLDMDIVCAVTDPKELLKNLRVNLNNSVYFLDLDLKSELDGF